MVRDATPAARPRVRRSRGSSHWQLDPARPADVLAFLRAGEQLPRRRRVTMAPSPPDERKLLEVALTGEEPAPAPSSSPAPSPALSGSKRRGSDSSLGSMIKDLDVDDGGSGSDVEVLPEPPKQRRRSLTPNRRVGLPQALKANKIKEETRASDEPSAGYGIVAKLVYGDDEKRDVIRKDVIGHMRKNWDEYEWVLKNAAGR